ncbi:MAG: phage tail tape measure protein [Duncaniella sp.]|uniref:phage tail tape measure protein n=1 Tax=Duncaniella sp. TaxID=2518496 RepID=UPI0023CCB7EA|nr:phage tail tape measure protein [Duncaniella sp.]MDE5988974.1 phage tail tape measure protein [Duncaniella sp.]
MSGIKDTATVTLNVNGSQAKQMMSDLEAKIKQTEARISSLKANMADPKDIEKARKQLKTYQKQLEEMKSATEGVKKALGNLDTATPRELEKALRTLNKQLKDMPPGSDVWESHVKQIKELKARLAEVREELKVQESWWDRLKSWVNDSGATILALGLGFDEVVGTLRDYVDAYASMEQEMANVRKFTGMTEEQVASLNEQFKTIDTRSSREQLNMLAQEAGRLGKSSEEDMLGFVRAADKINVALDDLGPGATLTLSKLTGIFGDEERYGTEQALLKVGSVINELSQNCSASAPYLSNFAERMGGVGAQANMTIQHIMGFGAVLDSNAQKVEASATALSQVIVRLYQDPAKYAKVAGLEVESFSRLMREDANSAVLLFLETLHQAGGMDVLSPMFKDMGENGSRAIAALSTLATHIDQVKAQQEAANVAFAEGTSIDKEFAVQNETVQASLDKCKNRANELKIELGERLYPLMKHFLTTGSALMRVLLVLIRFIYEHKGAIIALASAITAYLVVVNLAIIKQKVWTALCIAGKTAMSLWSAAVKLGAAAVALFSGNVRKAHLIWNAFARSIKAHPLGLLIAAITAAVGLIIAFAAKSAKATTEADRLARAQKKIAAAEKEAEANCAVELKTLEALYQATQDQSLAMGQRLNAVAKLQEQYPEYFKNLTQESILAGDAADAYERLRKNIIRSAQAEARKDLLAETERDILKVERERDRKVSAALKDVTIPERERMYYPMGEDGKEMYINSPDHPEYIITRRYIDQVRKDATEELAQLRKERELLGTSVANDVVEETKNKPHGDPPTPPNSDKDRFAEENAWRERQEAEARIAYAKGESTFAEHTARMATIAADYYQMLLDRTDVTGDEELRIRADYWEAVNKETVAGNKLLLAEEDSYYQDLLDRLRDNHEARLNQEGLSAAERQHEAEYYAEVLELAELQHLQNIRNLYEKGSDEWLAADRKFQEKQISARERHLKRMEDLERTYSSMKAKYFGDNPEERQAKYDKDFAALQVVYARELAAAGDNATERLRIEEAFLQAQNALRRQYGLESEENTRNAMERAVASSVEWLNSDGGKALTGSLSTITSGMSSIFSGLSSMIQAELEIQTAKIENRYDREVELAQGNSYKVAKLEKKKEADIAKAKNEANRKMFAMQVIQAVAQTAQNALSAYGSAAAVPVVGYILAPIAAAMAVAAGAIQIASIKKQQQASQAQGYSQGGFTKPGAVDEPAGIVHAGEWVASQKLLANPIARPMIDALDYAQRTNTIGSLRPDDVSRSITANNSLVRIAEGDGSAALMVAAAVQMSHTVNNLTNRLNEPFVTINTVTGDHGINAAKSEYDRLMSNKSPKSRKNATNH